MSVDGGVVGALVSPLGAGESTGGVAGAAGGWSPVGAAPGVWSLLGSMKNSPYMYFDMIIITLA